MHVYSTFRFAKLVCKSRFFFNAFKIFYSFFTLKIGNEVVEQATEL